VNPAINRFNELVRDGWSDFADGMIDFAADPTIGNPGEEDHPAVAADPDLYVGGTHPTARGAEIMAEDAEPVVEELLN
jgi:hypothetical protein